jgi:chromatin accessibility complex protein 1
VTVKEGEFAFPTSKLRAIMKSVPSLENVGTESLAVINKATELFATYLCTKGYEGATKRNSKVLDYDDLAALAKKDSKLQWIQDVLTERISYAEYLALPPPESDSEVL